MVEKIENKNTIENNITAQKDKILAENLDLDQNKLSTVLDNIINKFQNKIKWNSLYEYFQSNFNSKPKWYKNNLLNNTKLQEDFEKIISDTNKSTEEKNIKIDEEKSKDNQEEYKKIQEKLKIDTKNKLEELGKDYQTIDAKYKIEDPKILEEFWKKLWINDKLDTYLNGIYNPQEAQDIKIQILKYLYTAKQIAESKPWTKLDEKEKKFVTNILDVSNKQMGLDISFNFPPESVEKSKEIKTLADADRNVDSLVQDKDRGFTTYIDKQANEVKLDIDPKNPETFKDINLTDEQLKKLDESDTFKKMEDSLKTNFEEYNRANKTELKYEDFFDEYLNIKKDAPALPDYFKKIPNDIKVQKEKIKISILKRLSEKTKKEVSTKATTHCLKEFFSLFNSIDSTNGNFVHFQEDFNINNLKMKDNQEEVRLEWNLNGNRMGLTYNMKTGQVWMDDYLYQSVKEKRGNTIFREKVVITVSGLTSGVYHLQQPHRIIHRFHHRQFFRKFACIHDSYSINSGSR